jgi:hypothetical protein
MEYLVAILFTILIVFNIGAFMGSRNVAWSINDMEASIIERGYGLYCPVDKKFAFIGECEK